MGWKNIENRIITRTNDARKIRGLRPLRFSPKLHRAAKNHSKYMMRNKSIVHDVTIEKYGGYFTDKKGRGRYEGGLIGVNVVHYPHDSSRSDEWTGWLIFDIWMQNQRDWDTILSDKYKDVAVAVVRRLPKGKTYYVTQLLGREYYG